MVEHILVLRGPDVAGGRPRPEAVGNVLRLIEPVVRESISMGFRSTSRMRGRKPEWFKRASDIRFVDLSAGEDDSTRLHFEAPRFGEAAEDVYKQGQFFSLRPAERDTGFDLLADVLGDIRNETVDSPKFDSRLLWQVGMFKTYPSKKGVDSVSIFGDRVLDRQPAVLDEEVSTLALSMRRMTPPKRRARIAGKLDMIRDHDNVFEIILESGTTIRAVWNPGEMSSLTSLFRKDVVVEGEAIFRVSGNLLRIEAAAIKEATQADTFFRKVPVAGAGQLEQRSFLKSQTPRTGAAAIYGRWPGDETEEELLAALGEME